MKTRIEDITDVKKKLWVEFEVGEVNSRLKEAYAKLRKTVKIPGFRPGKVPFSILQARFAETVQNDLVSEMVYGSLLKALEDVEVHPVSTPTVENGPIRPNEPFAYTASFEAYPKFQVEKYVGIEVEMPPCIVTEEAVDRQVEGIRRSRGTLSALEEERPIRLGDFAVLAYEAFEDGVPIEGASANNFLVKVGEKEFHPEFEEALVGLARGQESDITVTFDASFYHQALAGRRVTFKVNVLDIKTLQLAPIDDAFAAGIDPELTSVEKMREKIREGLLASERQKAEEAVKQGILSKIADTVQFELPETLVNAEIQKAVGRVEGNLQRGGSDLAKSGISRDGLGEQFRSLAERRVKNALILGEIARRENITVSDTEMRESLRDLAVMSGQDPHILIKAYQERGLWADLENVLREEKALKYLMNNANIHERTREENIAN